jgi:hypothetical protein
MTSIQPSLSINFHDDRAMVVHISAIGCSRPTIDKIICDLVKPWIESHLIEVVNDLTEASKMTADDYFMNIVGEKRRMCDKLGRSKTPDNIPLLACLISNRQLDYPSVQKMLALNRTHNLTIIVLSEKQLDRKQEILLNRNVNIYVKY